jgi:hypothetical protein
MFLTMLLIDFFHEDWSARCYELRSQDEPFMVMTGDYRPLPVGATGLEIGAEVIDGGGWAIRRDGPCDPVDKWRDRSDERVAFEIKYSGVTPPLDGIGAFNLVLPPGWRFDVVQVDNPNYIGSKYMVARDNEGDREAVTLYFEGANSRFDLVIQAARGSRESDCHGLGVSVESRHIVEPSPVDTGTQSVLEDESTHSRPGQVLGEEGTQEAREGAVPPPRPWQWRGRNANYSWHPALNGIEDVLVAQVTDPSSIVDIIERVGMNPGTMRRGDGSAATLWHDALRSAWIAGHEQKVCELLRQTNSRQSSSELQLLIETYCGRQK